MARVPKGFYTAPGKPLKGKGENRPISGVSKDLVWYDPNAAFFLLSDTGVSREQS